MFKTRLRQWNFQKKRRDIDWQAVAGINSNGDDLPAVQSLHAKRPKKKRGLPGFVNGVRVSAMPDTGAGVNVVSEAYAQKMGLEIVESDASYRLGNSRSGRCIGK
jgi:hypothetical protein